MSPPTLHSNRILSNQSPTKRRLPLDPEIVSEPGGWHRALAVIVVLAGISLTLAAARVVLLALAWLVRR